MSDFNPTSPHTSRLETSLGATGDITLSQDCFESESGAGSLRALQAERARALLATTFHSFDQHSNPLLTSVNDGEGMLGTLSTFEEEPHGVTASHTPDGHPAARSLDGQPNPQHQARQGCKAGAGAGIAQASAEPNASQVETESIFLGVHEPKTATDRGADRHAIKEAVKVNSLEKEVLMVRGLLGEQQGFVQSRQSQLEQQAARINVLEQQLQDTTEALEDESTHHQADMTSIHQKLLHLTSSMQAGALQADMQAATEAFWQIMQVQAAVVEDLQKQNEDVARGGCPNIRSTPQAHASAGLTFAQVQQRRHSFRI
ncbi:hypothetical protein WJX84_003141 [Apatococcus fuscideae]|uniref:Uncharacterized protein n=1 Tax=Apatococcus fuscideae TaxID=2026836 RepID=A0AAW1S3X3_9CHLO